MGRETDNADMEESMEKRTCDNCTYATQLWGRWLRIIMLGWSGLRICFNSAQSPGRLQEVYPTGTCRNFHPRCVEQHHVRLLDRSPNTSRSREETRLIPLTHGLHAIVDAADFEWLSQYQWFLWGPGYAARRVRGGVILMHREIMKAPPGKDVDHFNGHPSDNRRRNLRICTRSENLRNTHKRRGCLSQYKGVSVNSRHSKWIAQISFERENIKLGTFDDEAEAARAFDRAALLLFGEYAWLNFPEEFDTRRQEIASPQYPKELAAKIERKKSRKRQRQHAKAKSTRRKSHAARRCKGDNRKRKRSPTKKTRRRSSPN
jgi:hypothetical protein